MDISVNRRWLRAVVVFGTIYGVIGIISGTFPVSSNEMRIALRLVAWLVSAVGFAAHIWYEGSRLHDLPRTSALHVSMAVALGALILAVAANVHELSTASNYRSSIAIALVTWPALTAVPAYFVALASAAVLRRIRRERGE